MADPGGDFSPNYFIFMQFLVNNLQNNRLAPLLEIPDSPVGSICIKTQINIYSLVMVKLMKCENYPSLCTGECYKTPLVRLNTCSVSM